MSKSRLEIPEGIMPLIKDKYAKRNGEIIGNDEEIYHLMSQWLTEIKEPLTVSEWHKENSDILNEIGDVVTTQQVGLIWNSALENQKLGLVVDEEKDIKAFHKWHMKEVGSGPKLSEVEYSFRGNL
ncbi:hypothetical protein KAR91_55775 [Candidatus Pacearchaeota archaeon]|nr:hypothetical protein [Candidatus Pacearchaeota archaeon]